MKKIEELSTFELLEEYEFAVKWYNYILPDRERIPEFQLHILRNGVERRLSIAEKRIK